MLRLGVRPEVMGHRLVPLALLTFTLTFCGCGSSEYVKISGRVTYEDGSLIPGERIELVFYPGEVVRTESVADGSKKSPRPGRAAVNSGDGTFDTVTTLRYGDGIMPGKYRVVVQGGGIPREYTSASTTPLIVDTKDSPFTLLVKKTGSQRISR